MTWSGPGIRPASRRVPSKPTGTCSSAPGMPEASWASPKSRSRRSPPGRCWCTAARTRWYRSRWRGTWSNCCPTRTSRCSPGAVTGRRSSGPTTSTPSSATSSPRPAVRATDLLEITMTMVSNHPDGAVAPTRFPLVDDDTAHHRFRVHRDTMTSPEIFREEAERIFGHSWLYVGHESEVAAPGDYVRRPVGGRPVFMVRGAKSGNVHVFHNTCTHRGAVVCRHKSGNAKVFQCFYHACTFDSEGRLTGVPDRDAYGAKLDWAQLGLKQVARVENYRGFVFASFDENATDLATYLAGAREYLDLVIDSGDGEMEIVKGTNEYCIGANWKLLAENSIDGYHAISTHDTYFKYLIALGTSLKGGVQGTARDLGNGHAVLEYAAPWGRPIAKWEPLFGEHARAEIAELRAGLVARHGEERASR